MLGSDFAVKLILLKRIRNILNNYFKKCIKWIIWLFTPIFISRLFVFYLFFIFLILNFLSLQVLKIKVIIFFFLQKLEPKTGQNKMERVVGENSSKGRSKIRVRTFIFNNFWALGTCRVWKRTRHEANGILNCILKRAKS